MVCALFCCMLSNHQCFWLSWYTSNKPFSSKLIKNSLSDGGAMKITWQTNKQSMDGTTTELLISFQLGRLSGAHLRINDKEASPNIPKWGIFTVAHNINAPLPLNILSMSYGSSAPWKGKEKVVTGNYYCCRFLVIGDIINSGLVIKKGK